MCWVRDDWRHNSLCVNYLQAKIIIAHVFAMLNKIFGDYFSPMCNRNIVYYVIYIQLLGQFVSPFPRCLRVAMNLNVCAKEIAQTVHAQKLLIYTACLPL